MEDVAAELQKKFETQLKDMENRVNKRMDEGNYAGNWTAFFVIYTIDAALLLLAILLSDGARKCSRHIVNWSCKMFRRRVQPVAV